MTNTRTKIVVLGGSGFLGQEVCRIARSMGHHVISISRHGRPDVDERWLHGIEWIRADVLAPERWTEHLADAEAVIDCIGDPGDGDAGERRSVAAAADVVAKAAAHAEIDKLVYLATCPPDPGAASAAVEDRRRAHAKVASGPVAHVILELDVIAPGDPEEAQLAGALRDRIPEDDDIDEWWSSRSPVRREKVAICALRAALEHDIEGVLDADRIAYLGDAMFIQ